MATRARPLAPAELRRCVADTGASWALRGTGERGGRVAPGKGRPPGACLTDQNGARGARREHRGGGGAALPGTSPAPPPHPPLHPPRTSLRRPCISHAPRHAQVREQVEGRKKLMRKLGELEAKSAAAKMGVKRIVAQEREQLVRPRPPTLRHWPRPSPPALASPQAILVSAPCACPDPPLFPRPIPLSSAGGLPGAGGPAVREGLGAHLRLVAVAHLRCKPRHDLAATSLRPRRDLHGSTISWCLPAALLYAGRRSAHQRRRRWYGARASVAAARRRGGCPGPGRCGRRADAPVRGGRLGGGNASDGVHRGLRPAHRDRPRG